MINQHRFQFSAILQLLENPWIWILAFMVVRIGFINEVPFGDHTWRQSITLGVARNYLEWDANFFRPRTLICGPKDGIFAQEFPIYNYLIFLGWKIFGQENWVFRGILLIANAFGLYWFYNIVRNIFNHRAALIAMVIMGSSIIFTYSFKAMPDTFAVSLALGGVWYGWKFLKAPRASGIYASAFVTLTALGILSKIPASVVMSILLIPFLSKDILAKRKLTLVALSVVPLVIVILWYFAWVPWAEKTYANYLFFPKTLKAGTRELITLSRATIERFEIIALQSRFVFYICLTGFVALVLRKQKVLLLTTLLYSLVFLYFMIKSGDVFSTHAYYVIPFIPLLAILGGYALDTLMTEKSSLLLVVLGFIAALGISSQWKNFKMYDYEKKYHRLEAICDKFIPGESRIMASHDDGNPMMLYFCHRKGWTDEELWKNEEWLAKQTPKGMEYVVVERFRHDKPLTLPLIYEDEDFLIYKTILIHEKE